MGYELTRQNIERRRDIVRRHYYTGLSVSLILERLEDMDALFPPGADYDERYSIIANDIAAIKKGAMEAISIAEFDAQQKHAEYVDRMNFLYHAAIQDGNIALAAQLSKSIAQAYGVTTDEPVVVRGDFLSTMMSLKQSAQRKLEERKVIDVTHEVIPAEIVKPAADVILNKH